MLIAFLWLWNLVYFLHTDIITHWHAPPKNEWDLKKWLLCANINSRLLLYVVVVVLVWSKQ